jgi:hypothetical protein
MISIRTKGEHIKKISRVKFDIDDFEIIYISVSKKGKKYVEVDGKVLAEKPLTLTSISSIKFELNNNQYEIIEHSKLIKGDFTFELYKNGIQQQKFHLHHIVVKEPILKRLFDWTILIVPSVLFVFNIVSWWIYIIPAIYFLVDSIDIKGYWVCEFIDV